jgi:hypothetical protein
MTFLATTINFTKNKELPAFFGKAKVMEILKCKNFAALFLKRNVQSATFMHYREYSAANLGVIQ